MSGIGYPEEFKIAAVKQVTEAGQSVFDVVKRLSITFSSLSACKFRYGNASLSHQAERSQIRRFKKAQG